MLIPDNYFTKMEGKGCLIFLSLIVFVSGAKSPHGDEYLSTLSNDELNTIPREIAEDALLDVEGLITKYGYPAETYEIQTIDGYLLTLHRIPRGKYGAVNEDRVPVLLMHGLLSSSADWIINGPGKAIGYILADEGYDVWIGNARGNYYSRKHIALDPKKGKFWRFSWDQIGQIDVPAMIDFILEKTGKEKLQYIGHSQGTTAFFVMASTRREYNDKIISMQALAPVAYMTNARASIFAISQQAQSIQILLSLFGINEFLPNSNLTTLMGSQLCHEDSKYLPLCTNVLYQAFGYSPDQLNVTMLPVYMGHTPAGASSRQFVHYAQLRVSTKFRNYDYGSFGNLLVYKYFVPPNYKLKYVKAPVALHYSTNDLLSEPIDVFRLHNEISNPIGLFEVPDKNFNHLDFIIGIDAPTLLFEPVIRLMKTFE